MKTRLATLAVLFGLAIAPGSALADCTYSTNVFTNCNAAIDDWWNDNTFNHNYTNHGAYERADSVGDVLRECIRCAFDNVENGVNQFGSQTGQNGNYASSVQ